MSGPVSRCTCESEMVCRYRSRYNLQHARASQACNGRTGIRSSHWLQVRPNWRMVPQMLFLRPLLKSVKRHTFPS